MSASGAATRWEELADWPLTAAALLFLGAYAWPILDRSLLRPLRLLRLVTLLTVLNRHVGATLRGRVAVYIGFTDRYEQWVQRLVDPLYRALRGRALWRPSRL